MYEITTNRKKKFDENIRDKKVYVDSVYDFTFEDRYDIYHYKVLDEYRYLVLDIKTGYDSVVISTKQPIHPDEYSSLTQKILCAVKQTGKRRYFGKYTVPQNDFIDIVFRNVLIKYGYAVREEQIKLSKAMFEGLTKKRVALCEAEVGTGKTMAYLVASLAASLYDDRYSMNGNPITISTSSIELQQAIIKKEIPELSRMLIENGLIYEPLTAVIRKGKEHFFCPARYNDFYKEISKYPRKYSDTLNLLDELDLLHNGLDLDEIGMLNKHIKSKICVRGSCSKCPYTEECRYIEYMADNPFYWLSENKLTHLTGELVLEDAFENVVETAERKIVQKVCYDQKPICVASDGLNLFDDAGGLRGFARFLETLNTTARKDVLEEILGTPEMYGWTAKEGSLKSKL